jgi:hypothetical protein
MLVHERRPAGNLSGRGRLTLSPFICGLLITLVSVTQMMGRSQTHY